MNVDADIPTSRVDLHRLGLLGSLEHDESAPSARVRREERTGAEVAQERRSFLGLITSFIGLGIAGFMGISLGRFSIAPALATAPDSDWTVLGPLAEIPEGKPTNHSIRVFQSAGWGRFSAEQSVWVLKQGEHLAVFSSVCPHLGCTINENATGFGCVCHNSLWSREGEKVGGPAPRAMDLLEHKVEDDILKVRYQNFKQGVAKKQVAT